MESDNRAKVSYKLGREVVNESREKVECESYKWIKV